MARDINRIYSLYISRLFSGKRIPAHSHKVADMSCFVVATMIQLSFKCHISIIRLIQFMDLHALHRS